MTSIDNLRRMGVLDARVPRYTSYPPANHFAASVTPDVVAGWLSEVRPGSAVSLYLHIPYCRRLCWFCACRTQGTSTDRPLVPYLDLLRQELDIVSRLLPKDISLGQIHLGGGTPTLLPPNMIAELGAELRAFRPWTDDIEVSVEIDPTEVDAPRIAALRDIGMTRASIGVQDFDPEVQAAIGRTQGFEQTRDVVAMLREAGVRSLNMDILYGLPHQTRMRMVDSVRKIISLNPDRVALYGYAHVPWMAKRQVMIPTEALPDSVSRYDLFEAARKLFLWDGYVDVGIDHFARPEDSLATAAASGQLRRNFQGYTVDPSEVLIGIGASAISRYPQGFAQNISTSSRYAGAIQVGGLATERGHAMSKDDDLRAALIEDVMCRFEVNTAAVASRFNVPVARLEAMIGPIAAQFAGEVDYDGNVLRLGSSARHIARMVAQALDAYAMPEGRHSRAL
jgi:oxygen-independent coproporphyrinogen-3 oxidase